MLRGTERKAALESLSRARTRYESQATDTQTAITDLFTASEMQQRPDCPLRALRQPSGEHAKRVR